MVERGQELAKLGLERGESQERQVDEATSFQREIWMAPANFPQAQRQRSEAVMPAIQIGQTDKYQQVERHPRADRYQQEIERHERNIAFAHQLMRGPITGEIRQCFNYDMNTGGPELLRANIREINEVMVQLNKTVPRNQQRALVYSVDKDRLSGQYYYWSLLIHKSSQQVIDSVCFRASQPKTR